MDKGGAVPLTDRGDAYCRKCRASGRQKPPEENWTPAKKVLVYRATNEVISSYDTLESKLLVLGWERCRSSDPLVRQYYRPENGPYLLTLPVMDYFQNLKSVHLYDIVVQSRSAFEVRDIMQAHREV
ncbi:hypothetical protein KP509_01G011600 [Ceratopteris richardii]|uniref:Uncharacterized protein n=1 Tax=Ceratopteris richardii TaxID=49495 RepID=A0A8T2VHC5_CERRI|nr:hypothetical protein KP509_01G011600 [Ceratopteris richardii]